MATTMETTTRTVTVATTTHTTITTISYKGLSIELLSM